jgi:hypothetical protein
MPTSNNTALKTTTRRLQLESLENRELMAGNVTVSFSGSELRIVGDSAANGVEVRQSSPGVYTITGAFEGGAATKINGRSSITASNVNGNVVVALGAGNDQLDFGTGDQRVIDVKRDLIIDMGTGNDWTDVRDVKVAGMLSINTGTGVDRTVVNRANVGTDLRIGDATSSVNSGDSDEVTVLSSTVRRQIALTFRGGSDRAEIQSCAADSVYADMGAGNDYFKMLYTKPRAFTALGGSGTDTFQVPNYGGLRFTGSSFESIR